jgi:hypothetical protein
LWTKRPPKSDWPKNHQYMIRVHWNGTIHTENIQPRSRSFGLNFPGAIWITQ